MKTITPYMSACGYIRSTASGLRLRVSLLEQSRRINAFSAGGKHILTRTVIEAHGVDDQPELARLLDLATSPEHPFDQLIVSAAKHLSSEPRRIRELKDRLSRADVRLIILEAVPTLVRPPMMAEVL